MRTCPACRALYPDADRFCETDGELLVPTMDSLSPTVPVAAPPADVLASSDATLTPSGSRLLLREASLLPAPRVTDVVEQVLRIAGRFDETLLAWQPVPEDFVLEGDTVRIAAARGVFRRAPGVAFDVRPALRALGEALLEAPVALCSTAVLRLLTDPSLGSLSVEAASAMVRSGETLEPAVSGLSASLAHVGYKRATQQDAAVVATDPQGRWAALVLCDGVSASADGGLAARVGSVAAAEHARELLGREPALAVDQVARDIVVRAHEAVCDAAPSAPGLPPGEPPGATIVVAVVRGEDLAVGWAGDSRAYVAGRQPSLLTVDHSWANAMMATGHVTEEEALAQPLAHALTRCIGPLDAFSGVGSVDTGAVPWHEPDVRKETLALGSTLVLCSDGVWAYMSRAEEVSALVARVPSREPAAIARALVHEALLRGGHDNVSVAVHVR